MIRNAILISFLGVLITACFDPRYEEDIVCSEAQTCPGDMLCDPIDNLCRYQLLDPTCEDDVQNADETDIDCGGSCPACSDGRNCSEASDCQSGVCTSGQCVSNCGDGIVQKPETCDDGGESAACDADCTIVVCGDSTLNVTNGEQCDDGNTDDGDGCDSICVLERCGDGTVNNDGTEQCDDGNTADGDGCNSICEREECGDGIVNSNDTEACDDGNTDDGDGCDASCQIEFCGDGSINNSDTEQCDDGNDVHGDGCSALCMIETCGDGTVNNAGTEQCDDGNHADGDGCSAVCEVETCGDGSVNNNDTEQCDDGNTSDGDGCSAACELEECGDGFVNKNGENCDDGNTDNGDGCDASCQLEFCGDGSINNSDTEQCDDGNDVNGDGCDAFCVIETCGDGSINNNDTEQCDDGNTSDGDGCNAICVIELCGDGVINDSGNEQCDDGNNANGDGCNFVCVNEFCGDGEVNDSGNEQCDDGNDINGDGCNAVCMNEECGDGVINNNDNEQCDDGNNINGDGCNAMCINEFCGDGVVNDSGNEQCDDGVGDSELCDSDCTMATCGDSYVNKVANEACDDGGQNTPSCDADCTTPSCGDGFFNPHTMDNEECDDGGNSATCDSDCTPVVCGDGFVNPMAGEHCEEGAQDTETCDFDCTLPICGDSHTNIMFGEYCDTGGMNSKTCDADCTMVDCGDAHSNEIAGEQCDDGMDSKTCDQDCTFADCGDLYVNSEAEEECDDGNSDDGDLCTSACEIADCTDGIWNADESDVDCGGQCEHACWTGQACFNDNDCNTRLCLNGSCSAGPLATGDHHTCALLPTGKVRCWGQNMFGQLGYGHTNDIGDDETPATAGDIDIGGDVIQIAAGRVHTCALLQTGKVRCWGHNVYGQLGYGNIENIGIDETPSTAGDVDVGGDVIQLTVGDYHTCVLLQTGAVRCWGWNDFGQLGYGHTDIIGDDEIPSTAGDVNIGGDVVQLAAGARYTCVRLQTDAIRCWGWNIFGQLGYGHTDNIGDDEHPATAGDIDVGGSVTQLAVGHAHNCVLLQTGVVRCWGHGGNGRLGYGNTFNIGRNEVPATAGDVPVGASVIDISAGGAHTCALQPTGAARCWGANEVGQLGYGHTNDIGDDELPSTQGDVNIGGSLIQLIAGHLHSCALLTTGAARCWGLNEGGPLGLDHEETIGDDEHPASAGDIDIGASLL